MPKVVIFGDMFHTTFPYLEMPLYNELVRRGIDVTYVLQKNDIRLTDPELSKTYSALNLKTIKKPKHLYTIMAPGDILLMRWACKLIGEEAARSVRANGNKILMYCVPGIDARFRPTAANYLAMKGESLKKLTKAKYPKLYNGLFVTGLLQADAAATTKVDKVEFMKSYGMDSDKKLVLVTPANPGELGLFKGINSEYKNIVDIVKNYCPGYEIAVKAHANDYTASLKAQPGIVHKNNHYGNKCSWESFAPGMNVIKADEGYKALKVCDAVLNVRSSLAMELSVFKTVPLININRSKYIMYWPHDPAAMKDIEIKDLSGVLNNNEYDVDEQAWLKYCNAHMHSNDGKAYVRIADLAEKILSNEI